MRSVINRLIEILFVYLCTQFLCYYSNLPSPPKLPLLLIIIIWLNLGHALKNRLRYRGLFSNWYAPFTLINETILSCTLAALTLYSILVIDSYIIGKLLLSIIYSIFLISLIEFFIPQKFKIPLFKFIIITSSFELYLILLIIFKNFNIDLISITILMILGFASTLLISIINYYHLRNYIFYQKIILKFGGEKDYSYKQKLTVAIHEASHLIFYTYFKETPKDIKILLFNEAKKICKKSEGLVMASVPIVNTESFLRWRMMLAISGVRGELLIFNKNSNGSETDFQQWRELSHTYLLKFDSRYTSQPITINELNRNKNLEIELYSNQIKIIDEFLQLNKKNLFKIANKTLVFNKLNYHQIQPILKKVIMTKKIPQEK